MTDQKAPPYIFDLDEVLVALIKQKGIHEGIWSLGVEFGFGAAVFSPNATEGNSFPTAFAQVHKIGLSPADAEGPLAVDAAKVNPVKKLVKEAVAVAGKSVKAAAKPARK